MIEEAVKNIAQFMELGGQDVPPNFDDSKWHTMEEHADYLLEEADETYEACMDGDAVEALDGFIDAAYVALSGAIALVGVDKTVRAFEAVADANLSKVDGRFGEPVQHELTGKILKPEGWKAPDIEGIIND